MKSGKASNPDLNIFYKSHNSLRPYKCISLRYAAWDIKKVLLENRLKIKNPRGLVEVGGGNVVQVIGILSHNLDMIANNND